MDNDQNDSRQTGGSEGEGANLPMIHSARAKLARVVASNPIKEMHPRNRANSLEVSAYREVQVILQRIRKERARPAAKVVNILTGAHRNRIPLAKRLGST